MGGGGGSGSGGVSVLTQGRPSPPPGGSDPSESISHGRYTETTAAAPLACHVRQTSKRRSGSGSQAGGRKEGEEGGDGGWKEGEIEGYGGVCVGVREVKTRVQMKKNRAGGM